MIHIDPTPLLVLTRDMFARDGLLRVETTTLLPDGSVATLMLRTRGDHYLVSDEGMGSAVLGALGVESLTGADSRRGADIAETLGVTFTAGRFEIDQVGIEQLPAAISYIAEACRRWTAMTLDNRQRTRQKDMMERAVDRLRATFPNSRMDVARELPGASNKLHRFDIVVDLPHERLALFEVLIPVASSMAAAHLKFYDLKQAQPEWPREGIVEDLGSWTAEDLAMMQQVATGIHGFDTQWGDLERLAA